MTRLNRIATGLAVTMLCGMAAAGEAAQTAAPLPDRGAAVYAAQKCSVCHALDGKGNKKWPLDSVGTKITAEEIRLWIVDPVDMAKKTEPARKTTMKAYAKLPPEDLAALVAFLAAKTKK